MKMIVTGIITGIILTLGAQYLRVGWFSSLFAGTAMVCENPSKTYQIDIYWSSELWHFDFNWKCKYD